MLRLANASKNPAQATAAAKTYFSDINDMYEFATKKDGATIDKLYTESVADLNAFKALI